MFASTFSLRRYATFGLALLLAVGLLAIGSPAQAKKKNTGGKKNTVAAKKWHGRDIKNARLEVKLMKKLMDRTQIAIEVAMVGDARTSDTAVKEFCRQYANRKMAEQDQLRAWMLSWYETVYTPKTMFNDDEVGEVEEELLGLQGTLFTATLLDCLVGLHNSTIAHAKQGDKKGNHTELRDFCKKMVAAEQSELTQLKNWMKSYEPDYDSTEAVEL